MADYDAQKRLELISKLVDAGHIVFITSNLNLSKSVSSKTVKKFGGFQNLFKVVNNCLYIAAGKKWECIDCCKITFNLLT